MSSLFPGLNEAEMKYFLLISQTTLHIVVILILAWIALHLGNKLIRVFKTYMLSRVDNSSLELNRIETIGNVFRYIFSVVITIVAGMLMLSEMGISIAPILATAGVAGIAIGFGAQSLIKDYFNGFFLLLEDQIRQGDVVNVANIGGLVEEITLRHVKLRDYDGNVHYIPNGIITTVTNMSRDYAFAVIDVRVANRQNVDEVMELMHDIAKKLRENPAFEDKIIEDLEMAGVEKLEDTASIVRGRIKVKPLAQWDVKREFLRLMKTAFEEHHIEFPYPHMVMYPGQDRNGQVEPMHIAQKAK
ncbi:MAG TPA: mechanosensitive ion channel family protein [Methylophilaceae bacterium]|jgi:small-conductance mechanosensitive channel|nr:mechanosensitive ion channel family protein [Methylophilaceae bacterium]